MKHPRSSGFTVLELLISLALLTMIGAALAGSVATGARIWDRSILYAAKDMRVVLRTELRRWIESAKPYIRPVGVAQSLIARERQLQFITTAFLIGHPAEAEARITLLLDDVDNLWVQIEGLDVNGRIVGSERRLLAQSLKSAQFRYYRMPDATRTGEWLVEWTQGRSLPALISVTADDDPIRWPPFTVAPKLHN